MGGLEWHRDLEKVELKWGREATVLKLAPQWEACQSQDGAASAVVMRNPDLEEGTVLFGFFDHPDGKEGAEEMLAAMCQRARDLGGTRLLGPLNFYTWLSYRWVVDGFDDPHVPPEPANGPHLPQMFRDAGFEEAYVYSSAVLPSDPDPTGRYTERLAALIEEGFSFETHTAETLKSILPDVFRISSQAFSRNPLFTPIPQHVFEEIYLSFFNQIEPSMDVCRKSGEVVGYSFSYPHPGDPDRWVWKTAAMDEEFLGKGLGSAFRLLAHRKGADAGRKHVYHALRWESNTINRLQSGGEVVKRYALFQKELG